MAFHPPNLRPWLSGVFPTRCQHPGVLANARIAHQLWTARRGARWRKLAEARARVAFMRDGEWDQLQAASAMNDADLAITFLCRRRLFVSGNHTVGYPPATRLCWLECADEEDCRRLF
jgi:hypothetical protein